MSLITRSSSADVDTTSAMYANKFAGLIAGEALDPVAPCRIHTDGLVYMSNGGADDANANIDGFSPPRAVAAGQPVTLFGVGTRFKYSDGNLTPGATFYIGATDGRLDDAATTGDAVGVAKAIDAYDIRIVRDS